MPTKPYRPKALHEAIDKLESQKERIERQLTAQQKKPKKKRGWLRRLFGWGRGDD